MSDLDWFLEAIVRGLVWGLWIGIILTALYFVFR